jgi:NhaP-type Na+/H+ or K+/H+ antiporter
LFGIAISFTVNAVSDQAKSFLVWNNDLFFTLLLPLIIFTTGYNIRRRKFFENFANITKLGLIGTISTFFIYMLFTWLLFEYFSLDKYNP